MTNPDGGPTMPRRFITATALALAGGSGLEGAALAQAAPPPPIVISAQSAMTTWLTTREATLQCDGQPIQALYAEPLAPQVTAAAPDAGLQPSTQALRFSINAEGRPRSIRHLKTA